MLRPRHVHDMVEQARSEQATEEWKQRYAIRAGVEGTIHQAVAVTCGAREYDPMAWPARSSALLSLVKRRGGTR
jgi:hypothetical protein